MRRRVGIYRATDENLRLIGLLVENPEIDVVRLYDTNVATALERARSFDPDLVDFLRRITTDDFDSFVTSADLHAVVDGSGDEAFSHALPNAAEHNIQLVSPLAARMLWAYGPTARERKTELLQTLSEVVESVELTIDSSDLFTRMLEIAIGASGADGGSLMLLDPTAQELRIRVAVGIESELWPKIRVPLGQGIAGRAAAEARSIRIAGKANARDFQIVRERFDLQSALCVPLLHEGSVLGVLNLHHRTELERFGEEDLEFVEQLANLDAQIITRAQEHAGMRDQAARYTAAREVQEILGGPDPMPERMRALCLLVAERAAGGIANLFVREGDEADLRLAATSLDGGGFAGEYRVVPGHGIDGRVAQSGRARFLRGESGELEYASLPLRQNSETFGVLSVQNGTDEPNRRVAEAMLLEIAAAIANGLAQDEREARLAERANRLSAINENGIRMLSASELTEVIRLATSSAAMTLDAEHTILRLQDSETKRFVIRSCFGPAEGREQEELFKLDKFVSRGAIQHRAAYSIKKADEHETLQKLGSKCRSLLASPLQHEGRIFGTLAVYDKIPTDRFYASRFDDYDLQEFSKLVAYVERAVVNARDRSLARQNRSFDPDTGLPNENYLSRRLEEEIVRTAGRDASLAVCVCTVENLDELAAAGGDAHAHRVIRQVGDALRNNVRDFDVVGRCDDSEFQILLPEPGSSPGDRVYTLARAVADTISKDETLNRPVRVALGFGYAIHPYDGADRAALVTAATPPRIRMV
ncbi:MAG: GAF domain-containing protein [Myxococcota bacterium]|nr:GAF domain-containing protein [Myxococcota bacterium]